MQKDDGDEELCSVYVPTNHLYIGDIFLVNSNEIIRPNLSIREGIGLWSPRASLHILLFNVGTRLMASINHAIDLTFNYAWRLWSVLGDLAMFFHHNAEIIVSVGMTMPQVISPIERMSYQSNRIPLGRIM